MSRGAAFKAFRALVAEAAVPGNTATAVRELLGSPVAVHLPGAHATPADVFRSIGSSFHFPGDDLDQIWAYTDPLRPRITYLIGFRAGLVTTSWRETAVATTGER